MSEQVSSRSFLGDYDRLYAPLLTRRAVTFRRVFEILERTRESGHLIVETGCLRIPGNWDGDGQSTLLFDRFAQVHEGEVFSVDRDPDACEKARAAVGARTTVVCQDSISFLFQLRPPRPIDLLYLDSLDVDRSNTHPSSLHHLKELCAIIPKLAPGALVVVDDNLADGRGKGEYVRDFMQNAGVAPVFSDYQAGWVLPSA